MLDHGVGMGSLPQRRTSGRHMMVRLSTGGVMRPVRMIMGTYKRATLSKNWPDFVKASRLKEFHICVFDFEIDRGDTLTIHRF